MNKRTIALLLLCSALPLSAQLPDNASALRAAPIGGGTFALRLEDTRRATDAGGTHGDLLLSRAVVSAQFPVLPGLEAWGEAGWHEAELANVESKGGFTWGLGAGLRPWRRDLRIDPDGTPRDWAALRLDLAARGGSAPVDEGAGVDLEWLLLESRVGIEWHQVYLGAKRGPIDSTGLTTGAGVILNQLSAERENFDADQRRDVGVYARAVFQMGPAVFFGLETDWYGGGDRRFGLISGVKF
jgi:hypothetical protein